MFRPTKDRPSHRTNESAFRVRLSSLSAKISNPRQLQIKLIAIVPKGFQLVPREPWPSGTQGEVRQAEFAQIRTILQVIPADEAGGPWIFEMLRGETKAT